MKDVAFRDHDVGRVLAGVDQVAIDTIHIEPRKGNVRVKSVEVTMPIGYIDRETDGVHVLGLVLKLPSPTTAPSTQPAEASPPIVASASTPSASGGGEIQIDRFQVNGVDFRIEDKSVDPPLVIPVKSLDLEVRGLSTAALHQDQAIRFNAILEADKVDLPVRASRQSADNPGNRAARTFLADHCQRKCLALSDASWLRQDIAQWLRVGFHEGRGGRVRRGP